MTTALPVKSDRKPNVTGRSHQCGRPGAYHNEPPAEHADLRGRPSVIELTRAERYWIQRHIQRLGPAADPMERRLLDKVRVDL